MTIVPTVPMPIVPTLGTVPMSPVGGQSHIGAPSDPKQNVGTWTSPLVCIHCGSIFIESGRCLDCQRATP